MKKLVAIIFTLGLVGATAYVLLATFVLEQRFNTSVAMATPGATGSADIDLKTYTEHHTKIYVADVKLDEGQTIQSALADNTYGKNITATTSDIAKSTGAKLAINGDFYGAQNSGYVVRNGELLRQNKAAKGQEDMVLWANGTMSVIAEADISAKELAEKGAQQVLSFGPGLVIDNQIKVSQHEEVGISMASNPRTALGYIGDRHYVFVVADGRTDESHGLSLYELAVFMQNKLGATQAYNLDGGGSATMYYDGEVVNRPTTNGTDFSERKVSDILYVK